MSHSLVPSYINRNYSQEDSGETKHQGKDVAGGH